MVQRIYMGKLSSLPPGGILERRVRARRVAVVNHGGTLIGIESDCKHMRASLARGKVTDGVLRCPWHGWRYELATGRCLTRPEFRLRRYEVTVEDDSIYLILQEGS